VKGITRYCPCVSWASTRGISAGFGTSYETLTNDYSNVNFSSGRMGWLEFNRNIERYKWLMMILRLCDKVYGWFIEASRLAGHIPFAANPSVSWTPPRRDELEQGNRNRCPQFKWIPYWKLFVYIRFIVEKICLKYIVG
jgi:hypothetical protein